MAIAEHEPSKLNPENRGLLKMSHQELHDFAATPRKNLPVHAPTPKPKGPDAHYYAAHGLLPAVGAGKGVPETKSRFRYKAAGEK